MATLINNQTGNAKSAPVAIDGLNTLVVTGAKMNDRVEVFIDDTPVEPLSSPPWARSLNTGSVDLRVNVRNNSGNAITVAVEPDA